MSRLNNACSYLLNPALCKVSPQVQNFVSGNTNNVDVSAEFTTEIIITVILILIIQVLPVVLIAMSCNPRNRFGFGLLAFLFPGVYLFQHSVRKYLLVERGYCGNK